MMYNNNPQQGYFNQNMGYPTQNNNVFAGANCYPANNGISFNTMQSARNSSTSAEDMQKIRQFGGNEAFNFTEKDDLVASWDLREGTNLAIELVDAASDRVRAKYTGEEFNIVLVDDETVEAATEIMNNLVMTTKLLNVNCDPEMSKEMYRAWGILKKLLPMAYSSGRKNYNKVMNQAQSQLGPMGYLGQNGYMSFQNGGIMGAMPNFVVNNGSTPPAQTGYPVGVGMGCYPNQFDQNNQLMQAMQIVQQAGYNINQGGMNMGGMGAPSNPGMAGTMMGGNPFTQNGQAQQMPNQTPVMNNPTPGSVPQVGTTPETANPSIGSNGAATTTTAPF